MEASLQTDDTIADFGAPVIRHGAKERDQAKQQRVSSRSTIGIALLADGSIHLLRHILVAHKPGLMHSRRYDAGDIIAPLEDHLPDGNASTMTIANKDTSYVSYDIPDPCSKWTDGDLTSPQDHGTPGGNMQHVGLDSNGNDNNEVGAEEPNAPEEHDYVNHANMITEQQAGVDNATCAVVLHAIQLIQLQMMMQMSQQQQEMLQSPVQLTMYQSQMSPTLTAMVPHAIQLSMMQMARQQEMLQSPVQLTRYQSLVSPTLTAMVPHPMQLMRPQSMIQMSQQQEMMHSLVQLIMNQSIVSPTLTAIVPHAAQLIQLQSMMQMAQQQEMLQSPVQPTMHQGLVSPTLTAMVPHVIQLMQLQS